MSNRFDINWPKLVLEFFSILLGVLLAFAASEWQQEREKLERAENAIVGIYHELEQNLSVLELIHENNTATVASMNSEEEADEDDEDRSLIPGIQMQSTAWETLKTTGVGHHVPYQTMMLLSKTYSILDVYVSTGHKLTESYLTMSALATVMEKEIDNTQFQRQFGSIFQMLVTVEATLLEAMGEARDFLAANHPI